MFFLSLLNMFIMWMIVKPFVDLSMSLALKEESMMLVLTTLMSLASLFSLCVLAPIPMFSTMTLLTIIDQGYSFWMKRKQS
jgi:hypothetical protein